MGEYKVAAQAAFDSTESTHIAGLTVTAWESVIFALGGEDVTAILVDDATPYGDDRDEAERVNLWALSEHRIASLELENVERDRFGTPFRNADLSKVTVRMLDSIVSVTRERSAPGFPVDDLDGCSDPLFYSGGSPEVVTIGFAAGGSWQIRLSVRSDRSPDPAIRQLLAFAR